MTSRREDRAWRAISALAVIAAMLIAVLIVTAF
jgi:hypothetical protein